MNYVISTYVLEQQWNAQRALSISFVISHRVHAEDKRDHVEAMKIGNLV